MIKAPQSGQTAIAATLIASKLWSLIWKTLLMCCGKSYSLHHTGNWLDALARGQAFLTRLDMIYLEMDESK